jgi:hypothetical protein
MPRRRRRKKKRPPIHKKTALYLEEILRWADARKARTGYWPKRTFGLIPESSGDKWTTVESALCNGRRGVGPGSTLAQLLAERRGVRNRSRLPNYKIGKILAWADLHHSRTGDWPRQTSGPIADAPGETWMAVAMALHQGNRGLPGGSTFGWIACAETWTACQAQLT